DTHYNDYPIGGRAVGFGGAYTAMSDDPSGIYLNPAGTVDTTRTSVDVSANLYGLEFEVRENLFSAVASKVIDFDTVFAELNIIPSPAGFIRAIGPLDKTGHADQVFGLGAFVPSFRNINLQTTGPGPNPGERITYRRNLLDRTLLGGAMYALRV